MSDKSNQENGKKDRSLLQTPADGKAFSQAILEENVYACNKQVALLDDIAESLASIALYFQRKGESENIFTPEDFQPDKDTDE